MATKRRGISKRIRFEIFKRDGFKCQYCGRSAPEVILHVDHVDPVNSGGAGDLLNLVTACLECNLGKGARELSDGSALAKQRKQLDELAERREQLEMMVKWRQGLNEIDASALQHAVDAFNALTEGRHTVNDTGRAALRKVIQKHGLADVLDAIQKAGLQYITAETDGAYDGESVGLAFNKIGAICRGMNMSDDERQLFYIRGICRNRFDHINEWECLKLLKDAYAQGASPEYLKSLAMDARYWKLLKAWLQEVIEEYAAERQFTRWQGDPEMAKRRAAALGLEAAPGETMDAFVARINAAVVAKFR